MAGATSPQGEDRAAGAKKESLWATIRDQLIAEVESGKYPAGALLPSVRELTAKLTISTTTARRALAEVVSAGYARSEGTRGHVSEGPKGRAASPGVDEPEPLGKSAAQMAGTLMVRPAQAVPLDDDQPETTPVDVRIEPAPAEVIVALGLATPDEPVVVRRNLRVDAHGTPLRLSTCYVMMNIAEGTPLAGEQPLDLPWLNAISQHTGFDVGLSASYVTARHPTDVEAAMLGLTPTACVLVRVETGSDEKHVPTAHAITVWPAEGTRLMLRED